MRIAACGVLALFLLIVGGGPGWSDDESGNNNKPKHQLTQREVDALTNLGPAPKDGPPPPNLIDVHKISKDDKAVLKGKEEEGVVKIIDGKDWKTLTPEQRAQQLRNFQSLNPPGTIFVLEIPSGNVWKFPPLNPAPERTDQVPAALSDKYKVTITGFTLPEYSGLPVAVGNDDASTRERSGTALAVAPKKEP
ncbi:MAG TPA: hypothetical protein VMT54_00190 [Candidatus Cybelea sp.]|nr:hypothetical protein [Candidatus Cybelea sp.]